MADIFISYASEDREIAKMLASILAVEGWSIWWDREIIPGQTFDHVIETELEKAKCVVVLWSRNSVSSEWVKSEAAVALDGGVLVPANLDGTKLPLEFRRKQTAMMTDWSGESSHEGFQALYKGIVNTIGGDQRLIISDTQVRSHRVRWWWTIAAISLVSAIGLGALFYLWVARYPIFSPINHPPEEAIDDNRRVDNHDGGILSSNKTAKIADIFPLNIGGVWKYNYGILTYSETDKATKQNRLTDIYGQYTETIATIDSQVKGGIKIIGVKFTSSGRKFEGPLPCEIDTSSPSPLFYWLVIDDTRMFISCADNDTNLIIESLTGDRTSSHFPEYVSPLIVGQLWDCFEGIGKRSDNMYRWHVSSREDITVPAGAFKNCYKIELVTIADTTIRYVCPGYGKVAEEYHHRGTTTEYRAELAAFKFAP